MWAEWAHASDAPRRPDDDPRWVCELEADLTVLDLREPATRRALRVGLSGPDGSVVAGRPESRRPARGPGRRRAGRGRRQSCPAPPPKSGWNLVVLPRAFERVRMLTAAARDGPGVRRPADRTDERG